jgi:hypothetical protein
LTSRQSVLGCRYVPFATSGVSLWRLSTSIRSPGCSSAHRGGGCSVSSSGAHSRGRLPSGHGRRRPPAAGSASAALSQSAAARRARAVCMGPASRAASAHPKQTVRTLSSATPASSMSAFAVSPKRTSRSAIWSTRFAAPPSPAIRAATAIRAWSASRWLLFVARPLWPPGPVWNHAPRRRRSSGAATRPFDGSRPLIGRCQALFPAP